MADLGCADKCVRAGVPHAQHNRVPQELLRLLQQGPGDDRDTTAETSKKRFQPDILLLHQGKIIIVEFKLCRDTDPELEKAHSDAQTWCKNC